jgi:ABC-type sugar transport system permease subunit
MGYASAMGIMLFLMLLIFTVLHWRVSQRDEAIH